MNASSGPDSPKTYAEQVAEQAADAVARGHSALQAEDLAEATRWFERARYLVPTDPQIALALAGVRLQAGDPTAAGLYAEAAEASDTREAWLGLAAAERHAGRRDAASAAIARLLSGHVLPAASDTVARLAGLVCADSEMPGWCGVERSPKGLATVISLDGATIKLDGVAFSGGLLPSSGQLTVTYRGMALLGSPIDIVRLRRVEGVVEVKYGGLSGWAWLPSDADTDPTLIVSDGHRSLTIVASDTNMLAPRPLTRPRQFRVTGADLAGMSGQLSVTGETHAALLGSPVDPSGPSRAAAGIARLVAASVPARGLADAAESIEYAAAADLVGPAAHAPLAPDRPVAIVVPVYRNLGLTRVCLDSVFASLPAGTPVIVVDDATPERELAGLLDRLAAAGRITLLRNPSNLGFPASANAGMRAALALQPEHDVLLLNSDTRVPASRCRSWLQRLRACVQAAPDIGSATPLSNDGSITSYPTRDGGNPPPDRAGLARIDSLAARANGDAVVDIPTAVGFCMYVRRECLVETGLFRPTLFAQGYGEENDFCLRARHLGWRHVAVPGVYVAHGGGASFGHAKSPLISRNLAVLERLYPGYHAMIAAYQQTIPAQDALAPARRRIDALRWATGRQDSTIVLVTHDSGGGVERAVRERVAQIRAARLRAVVLRPVPDPSSPNDWIAGLCRVGDGTDITAFPNLIFNLQTEFDALARLLKADRPVLLEVHHRLGHSQAVMQLADRLKLPTALYLHDYGSFCPRVHLLSPDRRYCGEPADVAVCNACVADAGDRSGEGIGAAALRARSAAEFAAAQRVVVPSVDMASRLRRHFPLIRTEVIQHEDDGAVPPPPPSPAVLPRRICVIGAIGADKGYDILLACARDAESRALPLEFVLVGHSDDDARLMQTGRVFITGRYAEADASALIRSQNTHLAFLPSILPETWGFTLSVAWQAGLRAAVFDIGAMAARVRATGYGMVLPLGLSAGATNQVLLAPSPSSLAGGAQDRLWTAAKPAG